jgi:biotin operon repressor/predicted nucleotidyltransferase
MMMVMAEPAAGLLPIFRSKHQMQILAEVFWGAGSSTGADLARRTGIPQQTVAREVARLEQAGVLVTEQVGSAKTIHPAPELPYGPVLRQLLAYAGGVIPMLTHEFGDNPAIDEVFIFGSWAARYRGEPGAPPNDVDVAVVSDSLTRFDLAEARLDLENESRISINLFVFEADNERLAELRAAGVPVFERAHV